LTSYAGRTSFSVTSPFASSGSGPPTRRPSRSISAARARSLLCRLSGGGINSLCRVRGLGCIDVDKSPLCCGASMKVKKSRRGLLRARRNRILHMKAQKTTITAAAAKSHSKMFFVVRRFSSGEVIPKSLTPIRGIGDALLLGMINVE